MCARETKVCTGGEMLPAMVGRKHALPIFGVAPLLAF